MTRTADNWLEPLAKSDSAAATALEAVRLQGLPSARDEHWGYAHLRSLGGVRQLAAITADAAAAAIKVAPLLPAPLPGIQRLVLVDGHAQAALSDPGAWSALTLSAGPLPLESTDPDLRFGSLAALLCGQALQLQPSSNSDIHLELLYLHTGQRGSVYPRLSLKLPANARMTLVERHIGGTHAESLLCSALDIDMASGSRLELHRLHEFGSDTLLLDQLQMRLADAAECEIHQLSAGGSNTRHSLVAQLAGRDARFSWHGAAVQQEDERHDSLVRIRHEAAATHSDYRFRALAAGRAHVSATADVLVPDSARGARVRQSLRGLIDGRGAHINLRPRLDINTNDIQASHGATTGQLDEQLLFYLLSRGLDAHEARAMLMWAFLADVVGTVRQPALRRAAEEIAARHLADADALQLAGSLLS